MGGSGHVTVIVPVLCLPVRALTGVSADRRAVMAAGRPMGKGESG